MPRRKPKRQPERLKAPDSHYTDPEGNVLTLRGSMTAATRLQYAEALAGRGSGGSTADRPAMTREDAWQRAVEFLFERLAVRWEIAGVGGSSINRQRELLARFRMASPTERAWVRDALREHCAEHFPDVQAP